MNWPKVCLKYQRFESFHSCFRARKNYAGVNSLIFPKITGEKEKKLGKEKTNKKKKKIKENLNFKLLLCKSCVRS